MPTNRRQTTKTRRAKEVEAASSLAVVFGLVLLFFFLGGGLEGKQNPALVLVIGLLTGAVWIWAIMRVKSRNAAGKTLEQLQSLTPGQFEEWVGARFHDLGYSVKVTGLSGDHGADLLAETAGEIAVIQCKNYKAWSVGEPVLRDLYGTMHDFKATKAYLVTTGQLTRAAVEWVKDKPIEVWDGEHLVGLRAHFSSEEAPKLPFESAGKAAQANPPIALTETQSARAQTCPKCGSALVERRNRTTREPFLGCSKYPACRHTEPSF